MHARSLLGCLILSLGATFGCSHHHGARLARAPLSPPPVEMERHSGRLWIELAGYTEGSQCVDRGERPLCFLGVDDQLAYSLERVLWPAFPEVRVKQKGDDLAPGDYILLVDLKLDALPPDDAGPGWSASAQGSWRLIRDGLPLATEKVASRSRATFPYGHTLAVGASEVVDAVAVHVAMTVGMLPETRPEPAVPLPPVETRDPSGPLLAPKIKSTLATSE
ncbi:MAG: hypothetical protein KC776_12160 [Myxococcales bacterium]|nr:hypothetical protein [Myxococcales bacterium]MCB9583375.1 hypothetical protein [Polyangiaceae bacterium]